MDSVIYKNPCQGRRPEKFLGDIVTHYIRIREFTICLGGKVACWKRWVFGMTETAGTD